MLPPSAKSAGRSCGAESARPRTSVADPESPSEDAAAIRTAVEALTTALTQIGQQVYEQQQAEGASAGDPTSEDAAGEPPTEGGEDNDETVEGEFREV